MAIGNYPTREEVETWSERERERSEPFEPYGPSGIRAEDLGRDEQPEAADVCDECGLAPCDCANCGACRDLPFPWPCAAHDDVAVDAAGERVFFQRRRIERRWVSAGVNRGIHLQHQPKHGKLPHGLYSAAYIPEP